MLRKFVLGMVLVTVMSAPAAAQTRQGAFRIGPRVGYINYDEDSAIREAAMLGLDGLYYITKNIGIGFQLDVARPQTEGEFFPAEFTFGDTTQVMAASQPLTILQYMGTVELTTGGRLALFINGSAGGYRLSMDPQVNGGLEDFAELGFAFGGGITFSAGENTSFRIEAKDYIHTDYDRGVLDPVEDVFKPKRFPDVLPAREPFIGSTHNIHLALGFSFTPGGSR